MHIILHIFKVLCKWNHFKFFFFATYLFCSKLCLWHSFVLVCVYTSFIFLWYSIIRTKRALSIFLLVDVWVGSSYPCILSSLLSLAMLLWPFLFMSLRCTLLDSPGCVFLEVEFLDHKVCSASTLLDNANVHFSLHSQWCGQAFPLLNIFINTWHFNIFGWR